MKTWHVEKWIRFVAGGLLLITTVLAKLFNPDWIWAAAFVGFMFLQSTITGFCPMELVLKALGVPQSKPEPTPSSEVAAPRAASF